MKRTLMLAFTLVVTAGALEAQEVLTSDPTLPTTRIGTRGAAFLSLGVGARAQALGGAYSALADDVSALYWNTAGIGQLNGFSAAYSQSMLYADLDIDHTFIGAVLPIGLTRIGVSVNSLNSGEMAWQDPEFPNAGFGGEVNPIRADFEWTGMAVGLHLARPITDRLLVGVAGKYITEGITGANASYIGMDLGTIFHTGLYGVTLGASLQNLGSSGRFEGDLLTQRINTGGSRSQIADFVRLVGIHSATEEMDLPTVFRFTVMTDLIGDATAMLAPNPTQNVKMLVDMSSAIDTDIQVALGVEYGLRDILFLRAGKKWMNEAQIDHGFSRGSSIGGGVALPFGNTGRFLFDYAYTGMADLENVQIFSLAVNF